MAHREMQLYTIYDGTAESYFPPFCEDNNASAIRQFDDLIKDPQSRLNKHAADYSLWRIGRYRIDTGMLYPDTPEKLIDGSECFKPTLAKEA